MQQMEHDPDERSDSGVAPRQSDSDRPPVGEPLVVSRHNPGARPAAAGTTPTESLRPRPDPAAEQTGDHHDQLDGRVALVTSAAGELGSALAAELVDRGARVLLVDEDLGDLVRTVDGLASGRAIPVRCDLGSAAEVDSACEFVGRIAAVDMVLHVVPGPGEGTASTDLDDRYRSTVRGPLVLFAGLVAALTPSPTVLVVGRTSGVDSDTLDRAVPSLVLEHLPRVDGMRVGSADCDADLGAEVFAEVVVDLLVRDDVSIERATFGGVADLGR